MAQSWKRLTTSRWQTKSSAARHPLLRVERLVQGEVRTGGKPKDGPVRTNGSKRFVLLYGASKANHEIVRIEL